VTSPDNFIWINLARMLKKFMRFHTVWAELRHSRKTGFNPQTLQSHTRQGHSAWSLIAQL